MILICLALANHPLTFHRGLPVLFFSRYFILVFFQIPLIVSFGEALAKDLHQKQHLCTQLCCYCKGLCSCPRIGPVNFDSLFASRAVVRPNFFIQPLWERQKLKLPIAEVNIVFFSPTPACCNGVEVFNILCEAES